MSYLESLDSEFGLLLLGTREKPSKHSLDTMARLLRQGIDEEFFLRSCHALKVSPLVYENLNLCESSNDSQFRSNCKEALREYVIARWVPQLHNVSSTICSVREALNAHGVQYSFLRGIPFAQKYYDDPRRRVSEDVDLLIHEEDRGKVVEVLLDSDFYYNEDSRTMNARKTFTGQIEFRHRPTSIVLDLNFRLLGNSQIGDVAFDMEQIWSRSKSISSGETELSDEDVLIELVRHACHGHDFSGPFIRTCCDIENVLRRTQSSLDWEYISFQAKAAECTRALYYFIWFYDNYFADEDTTMFSIEAPSLSGIASIQTHRYFTTFVLIPQLRNFAIMDSKASKLLQSNYNCLAKLWNLDNAKRLLNLLRLTVWPDENQLILIQQHFSGNSSIESLQRIRYVTFLLILSPGVLLGTLFFILTRASTMIDFIASNSRRHH